MQKCLEFLLINSLKIKCQSEILYTKCFDVFIEKALPIAAGDMRHKSIKILENMSKNCETAERIEKAIQIKNIADLIMPNENEEILVSLIKIFENICTNNKTLIEELGNEGIILSISNILNISNDIKKAAVSFFGLIASSFPQFEYVLSTAIDYLEYLNYDLNDLELVQKTHYLMKFICKEPSICESVFFIIISQI